MTLITMTEAEKKSWSRMVLDVLQKKADLKSDLFVVIARMIQKYVPFVDCEDSDDDI